MESITVSVQVPVETDEVIEGAVNTGGDRQDEGKWTRHGKLPQGFRSWKVAPNLKRRRMEWVQKLCCEGEREEEGELVAVGAVAEGGGWTFGM